MISKKEKYIQRKEKTFERRFYAVQKKWKKKLVDQIGKEIKRADNPLSNFARDMTQALADEYRILVTPVIAKAFKDKVKKHEKGLGFNVGFDLPTGDAVKYIDTIINEQWFLSIPDSIQKDIQRILEDGIREGMSYTEIAQQIQDTDPVTFSRSRANLWAVNEVGRAYGWSDFRADQTFKNQGYKLIKRWVTSHDSKVRASHLANEAQGWIDIDQSFSGTGDQFGPSSSDYRCRCNYTSKITGRV